MRTAARWLRRGELLILAVVALLWLFPGRFLQLAPLGLIVILLPRLGQWLTSGRPTRSANTNLPVITLLLLLPLAVLVSTNRTASQEEAYGILLGAAVYFTVLNQVTSPGRLFLLAALFLPATLAIGSLGLLGLGTIPTKFVSLPLESVLATIHFTERGFNANQVGGTLAFLLPPVIAVAAHPRPWPVPLAQWPRLAAWAQRLAWGVAAFGSLALLLTQSRTGLIAAGVALFILAVNRDRRFLWLLPVAALALAATLTLFGPQTLLDALLRLDPQQSWESRLEIWNRALYMLQDFAYTGIGLDTFDTVLWLLYPPFLISPEMRLFHAHNIYLQVGIDLGVFGLAALLILTGQVVIGLADRRRWPDPPAQWLYIGFISSLIAYFTFGLTDAVLIGSRQGLVFWTSLGAFAASQQIRDQRSEIRGQRSEVIRNDERCVMKDKQ